ncbi:oxidoreductase [Sinomonas sp. ASV322]|uniref:FAD-dependent oxidoreductase n=1 Tax=Sinomonas sp. ASV322 TaxID=3041920 RepID=UPI0027DB6163|nr:oxidoreductase [Sinomonas sp. ASV322]MDQ4502035.1 oxidoreductase [Sinomonas sp. ASV322]
MTPILTAPSAAKVRLDTALGRMSPYRLVLSLLAVLALYSMVLDGLGWLTFGVPAMLASLAVCVTVSYGVNRGVAALFRVRPHTESALVTGLLVYFLFWPSLAPTDLAATALACAVAAASKYVLAWRGRHALNPAAFGAFAVGLTGWSAAAWWVGTPAMLWAVVPCALLVLYRVERLAMAGVFAVVALAGTSAVLGAAGVAPGPTFTQTLAQGPLVFFAGFMLSEPVTAPGRRIHQLAYAAVIAAAYALPFGLGPISGSPELALLVGNALAFALGFSRGLDLRFVERRRLTPTSHEFVFVPHRPARFLPGQYAELSLPHAGKALAGSRRTFSFASAPSADVVTFGVGTAPPVSPAKQVLLDLVPGQRVQAATVGGDFVLPRNPAVPLVFVAGGIGLMPFASMLRSLKSTGEARDVVFLISVPSADELAFADVLKASKARVIVRTSDGDAPPPFAEDAGPALFSAARLRELVPDIAERTAYVSGPPSFVGAVAPALRHAGARRVRRDAFSGY